MQHKFTLLLAFVALHALRVVGRAQRRGDQRLGLAAGEERGAMDAGQHADLALDVANLVEGAVVGTDAVVQNLVAEDVLAH